MGTFRTLDADLSCERCGRVHSVSVQFKTGSDWQEHYVVGQQVSESEGLRAGIGYRAVADRYCDDCCDAYWLDEVVSRHEALAQLVEQRRLGIRLRGTMADLSPGELRQRGEAKAAELRANHEVRWRTHEGLAGFDTTGDGKSVAIQNYESYLTAVDAMNGAIDQLLKQKGWPRGQEWLREDLEVFVDPSQRVRLQDSL